MPPELAPLVASQINMKVTNDHWQDVLRLVMSIKTGTVTASENPPLIKRINRVGL
nr:Tn3 family transposase [Nitrosospira sp. Nsp11]